MVMRKGDPSYVVTPKRALFGDGGTEVRIAPLLDGIRGLSGEKIQWYLAAELRDRIRQSGVRINVVDRLAHKQYAVEPRQYEGRLLHQLPALRTTIGDIYVELYLDDPSDSNRVALFRHGTRVVEDLALLDDFAHPPWTLRSLQGHVDAPFVNLTPGTRSGLIHDTTYATLCEALQPLERKLVEIIEEQRRAEEEQASQEQLRTIQRAFREALLALPAEEYDWFDIHARTFRSTPDEAAVANSPSLLHEVNGVVLGAAEPALGDDRQRQFFDFAGPLFSVAVLRHRAWYGSVRPRSCEPCRAIVRGAASSNDVTFEWQIAEGPGALNGMHSQAVSFLAPDEPGLTRVTVTVRQRDIVCTGEGLITVTHELIGQLGTATVSSQGLPGYTFERAPGETWRSRLDAKRNVIVVNNGHRDFVYASRSKSLKLRYLVRLYAKELVMHNFVGLPADQLLERMVELSLRTEEHL